MQELNEQQRRAREAAAEAAAIIFQLSRSEKNFLFHLLLNFLPPFFEEKVFSPFPATSSSSSPSFLSKVFKLSQLVASTPSVLWSPFFLIGGAWQRRQQRQQQQQHFVLSVCPFPPLTTFSNLDEAAAFVVCDDAAQTLNHLFR